MSASSVGLHEQPDALSPATVDRHRAIVSLMEELEAIDWYDQRVEAADDPELAEILAHNRDEEKEHAAMTLEWLRRHDAALDEHLRTYLFTSRPVTAVEADAEAAATGTPVGVTAATSAQPPTRPAAGSAGSGRSLEPGSLGIGPLNIGGSGVGGSSISGLGIGGLGIGGLGIGGLGIGGLGIGGLGIGGLKGAGE